MSSSGDRQKFASQSTKTYCKVCNAHIDNNAIALQHHYNGNRHKRNLQDSIIKQRKEKRNNQYSQRNEENEIQRMQREAGITPTSSSSSSSHRSKPIAKRIRVSEGVCFNYQTGDCVYGDECKFKHIKENLNDPTSTSSSSSSTSAATGANAATGATGDGKWQFSQAFTEGQDSDSEDEEDEEEKRGMYVMNGCVYLVGEKHPEKMKIGLHVEIALGDQFDSDEDGDENENETIQDGSSLKEEEEEEEEISPWMNGMICNLLYTDDDTSLRQWRYRVQILTPGVDFNTKRDVLLEDIRIQVAPPPPPVDHHNQKYVDDVQFILEEKNLNTGIGGWGDVEEEEDSVEEEVGVLSSETVAVNDGVKNDGDSVVNMFIGSKKKKEKRSRVSVFGNDEEEEEEEGGSKMKQVVVDRSMYGGFKIGFNQKKEEESDVKKVKVGFKKRGKKRKKR